MEKARNVVSAMRYSKGLGIWSLRWFCGVLSGLCHEEICKPAIAFAPRKCFPTWQTSGMYDTENIKQPLPQKKERQRNESEIFPLLMPVQFGWSFTDNMDCEGVKPSSSLQG